MQLKTLIPRPQFLPVTPHEKTLLHMRPTMSTILREILWRTWRMSTVCWHSIGFSLDKQFCSINELQLTDANNYWRMVGRLLIEDLQQLKFRLDSEDSLVSIWIKCIFFYFSFFTESYPSNVHCALRYGQSPFSRPRKVSNLSISTRNRFHRLTTKHTTKQARFFHKNNIWDHPTCFLRGYFDDFYKF